MTEVVVVGGGRTGRAIAAALADRDVVVVDRSDGAQVVSIQQGTGGALHVNTVGVEGPATVVTRAVVLATGSRERTKGARLIAGSPTQGVYTGAQIRRDPHLVGRSAVVLGADSHGFAAVAAARRGGARVKAVVTPWSRHQVGAWTFWLARMRNALSLKTGAYITEIHGTDRVTGVDVTYRDGSRETVSCDTVVLTGDLVPEYEVALRSGLLVDGVTKGPAVDATGRTSRTGVFAAGSLVAPGWTGGLVNVAATAAGVRRYLDSGEWPRAVEIRVSAPLEWVSPAFTLDAEVATTFALSAPLFLEDAVVVVRQDARELARYDVRGVEPATPFAIPGTWTEGVDVRGGIVTVDLVW